MILRQSIDMADTNWDRGYQLTLRDDPPLTTSPIADTCPPTQQQLLHSIVDMLLAKEAREIDDTQSSHIQQALPGTSTVLLDDHTQAALVQDTDS